MPLRTLPLLFLLLAAPLQARQVPAFMWGSAADAGEATRTIAITPQTRWVNVRWRETVLFEAGGSRFAWRFDGPGGFAVELQQIAPPGTVTRPLKVYVGTPNEVMRRD